MQQCEATVNIVTASNRVARAISLRLEDGTPRTTDLPEFSPPHIMHIVGKPNTMFSSGVSQLIVITTAEHAIRPPGCLRGMWLALSELRRLGLAKRLAGMTILLPRLSGHSYVTARGYHQAHIQTKRAWSC